MKSQEKGMIYIISLLKYIFQFVYKWYIDLHSWNTVRKCVELVQYSPKRCLIVP